MCSEVLKKNIAGKLVIVELVNGFFKNKMGSMPNL